MQTLVRNGDCSFWLDNWLGCCVLDSNGSHLDISINQLRKQSTWMGPNGSGKSSLTVRQGKGASNQVILFTLAGQTYLEIGIGNFYHEYEFLYAIEVADLWFVECNMAQYVWSYFASILGLPSTRGSNPQLIINCQLATCGVKKDILSLLLTFIIWSLWLSTLLAGFLSQNLRALVQTVQANRP
ncbi:hypothetical protein ACH5RR_001032 [Cinchona calisaya]|uniref:Uncharacterized protein n=1 Tax=Cinchona calisaya TaxID=153742 RepID=A0ABD3B2T2_9GENT